MSAGLTFERAAELLAYDPESGIITRKARSAVRCRGKVGDVLGSISNRGYLTISVDKKKYQAHRLAWLLTHGEWPEHEIDHANGNKSDNRIANLRPATRTENRQNVGKYRSNTSGYRGVSFDKQAGKWMAVIECPWGQKNLGRFKSKEEAARTYAFAARILHGTYVHIDTVNIHIHLSGESPQ